MTRYPASAIFVLIVSPRPPMPPVTTATRCFAMASSGLTFLRDGPSLHHVHAAIYVDVGAGDVARFIGCEESHYRRDFLGTRQPSHRNRGNDLLADLGADRLHHVGLDVAGRHRVDRHALAHHFLRERLGEARHARLGRRIVGLAELAFDRVHRRDVDDAAPAALHHAVDHLPRDVEHAIQIGVDDLHPVLLGHALEDGDARDAGVVDEDVDRPDHRAHVVEHFRARVEVGDVALGGVHAVTRGAHRADPLVLLLVAWQATRDHGVAGLAQALADRAADAAHAARDEHDALHHRARIVAPGLLLGYRLIDHFAFLAHLHFLLFNAQPLPLARLLALYR